MYNAVVIVALFYISLSNFIWTILKHEVALKVEFNKDNRIGISVHCIIRTFTVKSNRGL